MAQSRRKTGGEKRILHSNKGQNTRMNAIQAFKDGELRILISTDVSARGLDVSLITHVINFDLPQRYEDYVHRIGRTGRAGASGEALSLVCAEETTYLRDIEKLVDLKIPVEIVEGFEPDPNASTKPIKQGQGRGNRNSRPKRSGAPKGEANKGGQSRRRPSRNKNKRSSGTRTKPQ